MLASRTIVCVCAMYLCVCASVASGAELLVHWPLDESSGDVAKDVSGHGHDGRIYAARHVAGQVGGALQFDGQKDYVALGDFASQETLTLAFWVKPEGPATDAWQGLLSTIGPWEPGVLHVTLRKGQMDIYLHAGQRQRVHLSSRPLAPGYWHHVTLVVDARQHTMQLAIDGVAGEPAEIPPQIQQIQLARQVLGCESDGKQPQRFFRGALDDVRIYAGALQPQEIAALCPQAVSFQMRDPRNVLHGHCTPDEGYCDQPYVVITRDGNWLCTLTTGPGREGQPGQHIVATISSDQGRTWSAPVDIEPSAEREASWVVPLVTPAGRVYALYTYNGDNVRELDGKPIRADTIGWYAVRYSDDCGRTWSKQCLRIPLRTTACDLGNDFAGRVQSFWGIDKPDVVDGTAYWAFTKLGKLHLQLGEGWFFRSDNILTEPDATQIRWTLMPDGEHGMRVPEYESVQEEHNLVPLSGRGRFYCVYRTTFGISCQAYSDDGCRTWTRPEPMTYTPGGRPMKNPRACPMLWRTAAGKYLFWYHNNGGKTTKGSNRNPVWISGGVDRDGRLHWSQPEILLFDTDLKRGMSYPDLIEQNGRYWVTETQKKIARVHEVDRTLLEGLWTQGQVKEVARQGLLLDAAAEQLRGTGAPVAFNGALDLRSSGGMTLDVWLKLASTAAGQVILDTRDQQGRGLALTTADKGTLRLELSDGIQPVVWETDPGLLAPGPWHHVVTIADTSAGVLCFVVDGVLCDGGQARECGWCRLPADLRDVSGSRSVRVAAAPNVELARLRIYGRALRTSEAVGNYHAGR